jgi:hypothetical protein
MRPLRRLPNGNSYADYRSYKDDLLARYGPYCAYCEKKDHDLDVEHVHPKSKGGPITDWNNLLLGCPTCNRDFKKSFNVSRKGYIFPDHCESFRNFHYRSDGTIKARSAAAVATRKLCGLDRAAANSNRIDVYKLARSSKDEILSGKRLPVNLLPWITRMGHWSVWMTVFHDVPAVIALLTNPVNFPGTRSVFLSPRNSPKVK